MTGDNVVDIGPLVANAAIGGERDAGMPRQLIADEDDAVHAHAYRGSFALHLVPFAVARHDEAQVTDLGPRDVRTTSFELELQVGGMPFMTSAPVREGWVRRHGAVDEDGGAREVRSGVRGQ